MEWFVIGLTLVGLAVGGHHFVIGAAAIGRRCGMNPVLVGATIVAFGTSLPELGVSLFAAWQGFTEISTGNVVGSNVCNVCLILGFVAMMSPMKVSRDALSRDGTLMLVATVFLLLVTAGGTITRREGWLLLATGLTVTVVFVITRRENSDPKTPFYWWDVPRALLALCAVLVSSRYFVGAAESLAQQMGVSQWTIGITIAAIGTSLPELVTTLAAVAHRHTGMVIGNVLGSNTFNILFVLGIAATVRPLESSHFALREAGIFAGLMLIVLGILWSQWTVSRLEGATLATTGFAWYLLGT